MCGDLVRQVYPDYRPDYHRLVLINPNSSELLPQRRWDRENFNALAAMVVERVGGRAGVDHRLSCGARRGAARCSRR